jgi:C_GCAxxG_C_C family probable redox protein
MSKIEEALSCFQEGFACSQAILSTYGERYGLERHLALRMGEGFGGGTLDREMICGAVQGAIMVIGLKHGRTRANDRRAKARTVRMVREFVRRFEIRNRTTLCGELLRQDGRNSEGFIGLRRRKRFARICPKVVRDAAEIIEEIL